jgi:hypothetical protein
MTPQTTDLSFAKGGPLETLLEALLARAGVQKKYAVSLPRRAVVSSLVAWLPLLVFSAFAGAALGGSVRLPFLLDFPVAVRLLVALPLLVAAQGPIDARALELARYLVASGVIDARTAPSFTALVQQVGRMRDSILFEAVAVVGVIVSATFFRLEFSATTDTWQFAMGSSGLTRSAAGWWYLCVSVPVFQFLIYRWLWRYMIWCWILWRLSKLDLRLIPTHPDGSAGLAILGHVQAFFWMVTLPFSSILSSHVAQEVLHGRSLPTFRLELAVYVASTLIVFLAPLLVFSSRLLEIRRHGLGDYGILAAEYTQDFDRKWIARDVARSEPLIGSADIQSLADLASSYAIIREMRIVPFDLRTTVLPLVVGTLAPFLPLALLVISPLDVLKGLVQILL